MKLYYLDNKNFVYSKKFSPTIFLKSKFVSFRPLLLNWLLCSSNVFIHFLIGLQWLYSRWQRYFKISPRITPKCVQLVQWTIWVFVHCTSLALPSSIKSILFTIFINTILFYFYFNLSICSQVCQMQWIQLLLPVTQCAIFSYC